MKHHFYQIRFLRLILVVKPLIIRNITRNSLGIFIQKAILG